MKLAPRRPYLHHAMVMGFYFVLTIIMTWPVVIRLNSHMAGTRADNQHFVWTVWTIRRSFLAGSGLYTTDIYYPEGVSLALHTNVLTKSIPAIVSQSFFTPVVTYNMLVLLSITLCGYTAWVLVRYITGNDGAAIVGGIIYAFSPVLLAHATAGHLNFISAEGIPLFIFFVCKAVDYRRWPDAVFAGMAAAYTALSNWSYGLFVLIFVALLFFYRLLIERRAHLRWSVLRQYLISGMVALLLTGPVALSIVSASRSSTYDITRYLGGAALFVSDLVGFFIPSPHHFLVGRWVEPLYDRFTGNWVEATVFVGFSVLILSSVAVRQAGRTKGLFWLIVAIVFAIFSLGPGLHILGHYQFPWLSWLQMGTVAQQLGMPMKPEWVQMFNNAPMIPLPGAVLQLLPIFRWTRAPSRYMIMTMLALAVLAGFGLCYVQDFLQGRRWFHLPASTTATIIVAAIILFEFSVLPFPTTPATLPNIYRRLAQEPGEFGILELPIRPYQLQPQYWQTFHGKPLVYGHISRVPEERFAYLDSIANEVFSPDGVFEKLDIRYLILHEDQLFNLDQTERASLEVALETNFELVTEGEDVRVYLAYPTRSELK